LPAFCCSHHPSTPEVPVASASLAERAALAGGDCAYHLCHTPSIHDLGLFWSRNGNGLVTMQEAVFASCRGQETPKGLFVVVGEVKVNRNFPALISYHVDVTH